MKTKDLIMLVVLIFLVTEQSFCRKMVYFSAIDNSNNQPVKPDSILVTDYVNHISRTITVDSVDLDLVFSDVPGGSSNFKGGLLATQNFPNPFEDRTDFTLYKAGSSNVGFDIYDIMGNSVFSQEMYMESGENHLTLNTGELNPGIYLLGISDNSGRQLLKLIKTGNTTGEATTLIIKGVEKGNAILELSGALYSFKCYAHGYTVSTIINEYSSAIQPGASLEFLLEPIKQYGINSGSIEISGIQLNFSDHIVEYYDSGGGIDTVIKSDSIFSINQVIENLDLPNSRNYYVSFNGDFLGCNGFNNNNYITDFCYKLFDSKFIDYTFESWMNYYSTTLLTSVQFDSLNQIIDTLKMTFYNRNISLGEEMGSGSSDEKLYRTIILTNVPYFIDSQNNILAELDGKLIENHFQYYYSSDRKYSFGGDSMGREGVGLTGNPVFSDSSKVKLILSQQ